MRKALVLGEDSRAFLSVVRSLGRGGVQVHVAWANPNSLALHSRYIYKIYSIPEFGETGIWKKSLITLMQAECFDLVIPCSDAELIPLQTHRAELEPHGRLYLVSDHAFEVLFNKIRTNELARSVGVNVPNEVVVSSAKDADAVVKSFSLPVVLKPRSSFSAESLHEKQLVRKAFNWSDYGKFVHPMLETGPVAVQENFIGIGVGIELLMQNGEVLLSFQHERVHEPLHGGGSSYRKSVPVSAVLLDASVKLLHALSYTGVAMVEFKVNPKTRDWVLIEVNARFWGSLPLALAAGTDFPYALFQMLVDGKNDFTNTYRNGIYSRNLEKDMIWQISNLRADRSNLALATRPIGVVIRDACMNMLTLREHIDTFTIDDPAPGLAEVRGLGSTLVSVIKRRLTRVWLESKPGRIRLQYQTRRAIAQASSIVVVCKGNICRSPFAAQLMYQYLPSKSIVSAGYYKNQGRNSPTEAIAAAMEWGVDLRDHRSVTLTAEMVAAADIILIFDFDNYERIRNEYPSSRGKLHLLGAIKMSGPLLVEDPWGGDREKFRSIYGQIVDRLAALQN